MGVVVTVRRDPCAVNREQKMQFVVLGALARKQVFDVADVLFRGNGCHCFKRRQICIGAVTLFRHNPLNSAIHFWMGTK